MLNLNKESMKLKENLKFKELKMKEEFMRKEQSKKNRIQKSRDNIKFGSRKKKKKVKNNILNKSQEEKKFKSNSRLINMKEKVNQLKKKKLSKNKSYANLIDTIMCMMSNMIKADSTMRRENTYKKEDKNMLLQLSNMLNKESLEE